jgi:MFS family permease
LGITMLPFAVVAPLIGPLLDRFGHGRRWAIGATFAVRAILCIVMADAIAADNEALMFAAALGTLVSSKAYGVTRAAAVPRLVPEQLPLMKANSRISLAGVLGGRRSGPARGWRSYLGI